MDRAGQCILEECEPEESVPRSSVHVVEGYNKSDSDV